MWRILALTLALVLGATALFVTTRLLETARPEPVPMIDIAPDAAGVEEARPSRPGAPEREADGDGPAAPSSGDFFAPARPAPVPTAPDRSSGAAGDDAEEADDADDADSSPPDPPAGGGGTDGDDVGADDEDSDDGDDDEGGDDDDGESDGED